MNKREIGTEGEEIAVRFLREKGLEIIKMNYSCKIGEIDIIAKDNETFVFVEVKLRKNIKMGRPYEAVNYNKQMKIMRTAMVFAGKNNLFEKPIRFDVIEIIGNEILWIPNAWIMKNNFNYL